MKLTNFSRRHQKKKEQIPKDYLYMRHDGNDGTTSLYEGESIKSKRNLPRISILLDSYIGNTPFSQIANHGREFYDYTVRNNIENYTILGYKDAVTDSSLPHMTIPKTPWKEMISTTAPPRLQSQYFHPSNHYN